jgi:hypothetical protein
LHTIPLPRTFGIPEPNKKSSEFPWPSQVWISTTLLKAPSYIKLSHEK